MTDPRPIYERHMLTDPAIVTDEQPFENLVNCQALQTDDALALFERVRGYSRRYGTYTTPTTVGATADNLRVTPEEVCEAILGWGYLLYFDRDPSRPIRDWKITEDGE